MSAIRITAVVPTITDTPDWVREAMVGATFNINGTLSQGTGLGAFYAVEGDSVVHGLKYFGTHPDQKKAADWFALYFKLHPQPLHFRGDWCDYLP